MQIEIWSLGRESESYIQHGIENYFQKTSPWNAVSLKILQLPKKMQTTDTALTLQREEAFILKQLQPNDYFILLDERGRMLTSPEWASQFQQCMNNGVKRLVILIGGAFGVTETIRQKAHQTWSLSRLVFPHQLVRLIVAEQVYRAFSIIHHSPYHHM